MGLESGTKIVCDRCKKVIRDVKNPIKIHHITCMDCVLEQKVSENLPLELKTDMKFEYVIKDGAPLLVIKIRIEKMGVIDLGVSRSQLETWVGEMKEIEAKK